MRFHRSARALTCAAFLALSLGASFARPIPAAAQSITTLTGIVTLDGKPASGAAVTAVGANAAYRARADAGGRFGFGALPVGTYALRADAGGQSGSLRVDLTSSGAQVTVAVTTLREIGRTNGSSGAAGVANTRSSGTDVALNAEVLKRSPANGNFSEILLQVPGAARGANGVVHINGDHGDINYVVNGVSLPQELNRVLGSEVDPNDVAFADVLEGAYPAQYGEKFGSVINIGTRNGSGPRSFSFDGTGGSYGRYDSSLGYHTPVGPGGSFVAAIRNEEDGRALDPPNQNSPHDRGSNTNQFLRLTLPKGNDFVDLTFSHSFATYQIPPDVASGAPARTDDGERQDDLFGSLQYRHAIGDHGAISFGPSIKRSRIVDYPDLANDLTFGLENGGVADCSGSLNDPSQPQCSNSVFADRASTDYRFNADYALRSAHHEIRAGAVYDLTTIAKNYAATLQPNNPYGAAPFTVRDRAPNTGHTQEAYLQDSWRMGGDYELDYGLRYDTFSLASSQFVSGSSMVSPRVKLTRFFGPRASAYVYYGRFFTPYSFENISPAAARLITAGSGNFDLLPQRDSDYEAGFHLPAGRGEFGVRVAQKDATDLIDDTQVGFTNLHQDINYKLGRIATQTGYYQLPLARSGRAYASATHTYSVVKGCETQLLAPCFNGPALDWVPADHDQRWDLNAGILVNDRHNGWLSLDGEYGSGLTSASGPSPAFCPSFADGDPNTNCKVPPHVTFDAEKGFGFHGGAITLRVRNLFNDKYLVTYANAQGNHYARPRSVELGFSLNGR